MEINETAPAYAVCEIEIKAPATRVWDLLSDIEGWPQWNPDISQIKLQGPLVPESTFRWKAGGSAIRSEIQEVVPGRSLGWTGKASGARAAHLWTIEDRGQSSVVRTQESFDGWIVVLFKGMMRRVLHNSLEKWLAALKRVAEA